MILPHCTNMMQEIILISTGILDPIPKEMQLIMDSENHEDPSTWKWTAADKLFLKVINECHKRGIRVIMDYSWNHTGRVILGS